MNTQFIHEANTTTASVVFAFDSLLTRVRDSLGVLVTSHKQRAWRIRNIVFIDLTISILISTNNRLNTVVTLATRMFLRYTRSFVGA